MSVREYTRFSGPMFDGEKVKLTDILGENLIVLDFAELPSQYHENTDYLLVNAELTNQDQKKIVFTTGSQVLLNQLKKEREKGLPFAAKIVKQKRYFTLAPREPASQQKTEQKALK